MLPVLLSEAVVAARHTGSGKGWRAVEAQHLVSTLRLTGNDPVRQDLLERILEESKPPLPEHTAGLHYLLATPFRYPPSRSGSRFRAWPEPGVLYAAEHRRTACAELGYWRWRFVQDSAGLSEIPAAAQTVFQLGVTGVGIDLRKEPLVRWHTNWTDPVSYSQTQRLAKDVRNQNVFWIAYESVRDPEHGLCYAVLDPRALRPRQPLARETWYLTVTQRRSIWQREGERFVFEFCN